MNRFLIIFVFALSVSVFSQCRDNSECKGNRVCFNGVCTDRENVPNRPAPQETFGRVAVSSNPQGGRIFLDGMNTGKTTPAVFDSIVAGPHVVEVLGGYLSGGASVVAGRKEMEVVIELQPGVGNIIVSAEPANATVLLDGENKGNIPWSLKNIPAGKHIVQASAQGFGGLCDTVDLFAGCTDTLHLKLKGGAALSIATKPIGATIVINGTQAGKAPYTQTGFMPGDYKIDLRMPTYVDTAFTIALSYDQKISLLLNLRHTDQFIKERKHKKSVVGWTIRGIAGAAAIGAGIGGLLYNATASRRYDEYSALKDVGNHSDAFDPVKKAVAARNILYGISCGMLGVFGISFAF
jgi:hypothetical protein